ncbi:hypothetical protein [Spirosoma agri]|uniref:Ig-like domain-containing protein n=1 Tax=Spirosoma agri TaxID=1987381 RepID=A0A6M0IHV2_9BACT|nr:hypothetical protein [Spirosoma agri]NEU67754.1 hypothetical protein [Spirosoma agri]
MKNVLNLLVLLCLALPGFGQNVAKPKAIISSSLGSYTVTAPDVPKDYYGRGDNARAIFRDAVYKGEWRLVTDEGCIIPKGTIPPAQKPNCSTVVSCDYQIAVNSPSVGCSETVLLTTTASGTAATGLAYTWTGPGGQTIAGDILAVASSTNGAFQYVATVSKAGCTSKTAVATLTVTGCQTQTTVTPSTGVYAYRGDDFDYTPYADADQSNKFPVFENSNIYVSLALRNQLQGATQPGLGGGIYQIKNKQSANPDHVLVNVPNRYIGDDNGSPDRNRTPDFLGTGQGLGECVYESPKPYYATGETGVTTAPNITQPVGTDPGLGYNPFELGDDFNNTGRLLKFGKSTNGFYTAMGPMAYGQNRVYLGNEVLMEKWGEVSGKTLSLHYQTTFNRAAFSRAIDKAQEAPCLYVPGGRKFVWYDGPSPYTNGGLTEIIAPVNTGPGGNGLNKGLNGMRDGNVFPTENWIANIGENGYGIGLILYDNIMTSYGYAGDGGADMINPNSGGSWGYIGWNPQEVLDFNIRWRHRVKLVVGTVSEIRQEAYSNPYRPASTPRFKFNRAGREGWIFNAGDNENEKHTWDDGYTGNARAGWKVYFSGGGDYSASMTSPGGIWYTNQFNKLYIRYKYSGRETEMELKFQRNRQLPNNTDVVYNAAGKKYGAEEAVRYANGGADQDGQRVKFAVIGDGQWHTAVVDFAGLPKWTGIISRFVINPHYYVGGKTYQDGESMTIDWMNTENTDPFPN